MSCKSRKVLIVCLLSIACTAVTVHSQPPTVPRLTERHLDDASYIELVKEWKKYIEKNGESADALVNLARAYNYSGEEEAALIAAKRAAELGPDNPNALAFLGSMLAVWEEDEEGAIEVLEHCLEVAPDHEHGLTMLGTVYLRRGELEKSEEIFKAVYNQRIISAPLQDYAYNMLVGLPQGAVLVTSGDNDTFPPLALQAGMNFRKDVVIINRSLLNLIEYGEGIFKHRPSIKPEYQADPDKIAYYDEDGKISVLSNRILEIMIKEQKVPIYFAVSVANLNYFDFNPKLYIEGLNMRTIEKGLSAEESAKLFLDTYRLDSVTDWNFAWSLVPSVTKLVGNYVTSMIKLAEHKDIKKETKFRLLEKALSIAEFHEMTKMMYYIKSLQNK